MFPNIFCPLYEYCVERYSCTNSYVGYTNMIILLLVVGWNFWVQFLVRFIVPQIVPHIVLKPPQKRGTILEVFAQFCGTI